MSCQQLDSLQAEVLASQKMHTEAVNHLQYRNDSLETTIRSLERKVHDAKFDFNVGVGTSDKNTTNNQDWWLQNLLVSENYSFFTSLPPDFNLSGLEAELENLRRLIETEASEDEQQQQIVILSRKLGDIYTRYADLQKKYILLEVQNKHLDVKMSAKSNQVAKLIDEVKSWRLRALNAEKITRSDNNYLMEKALHQNDMNQSLLEEERCKIQRLSAAVLSEKREKALLQIQLSQEIALKEQANIRIAQLENTYVTKSSHINDNVFTTLEPTITEMEKRFKNWAFNYLPRLISGLPLSETDIVDMGDSVDSILDNMKIDKTYALSQALICSEITISKYEVKLRMMTEKLIDFERKNSKLVSILNSLQVQDPITERGDETFQNLNDRIRRQEYINDDQADRSSEKLRLKQQEVEQLRNELIHTEERYENLERLYKVVVESEERVKLQAIESQSQMRLHFENILANEFELVRTAQGMNDLQLSAIVESIQKDAKLELHEWDDLMLRSSQLSDRYQTNHLRSDKPSLTPSPQKKKKEEKSVISDSNVNKRRSRSVSRSRDNSKVIDPSSSKPSHDYNSVQSPQVTFLLHDYSYGVMLIFMVI
jgi:hypothetical protein